MSLWCATDLLSLSHIFLFRLFCFLYLLPLLSSCLILITEFVFDMWHGLVSSYMYNILVHYNICCTCLSVLMFSCVFAHDYACVCMCVWVTHIHRHTHTQSAYSNTQPMWTRRTGQTTVDKGGQQETRMSLMCLTAGGRLSQHTKSSLKHAFSFITRYNTTCPNAYTRLNNNWLT